MSDSSLVLADGVASDALIQNARILAATEAQIAKKHREITQLQSDHKRAMNTLNASILSGIVLIPVSGVGRFMAGKRAGGGSIGVGNFVFEKAEELPTKKSPKKLADPIAKR